MAQLVRTYSLMSFDYLCPPQALSSKRGESCTWSTLLDLSVRKLPTWMMVEASKLHERGNE